MRVVVASIVPLLLASCGQPESEQPPAKATDISTTDDAVSVEAAMDGAEAAAAAAADAAEASGDAVASPDNMTGSARPSSETPMPMPSPKPESNPRPTTDCARPSDC